MGYKVDFELHHATLCILSHPYHASLLSLPSLLFHTHAYMYSHMQVLGRCTVDIRVCASPGRDRGADERKMAGEVTSTEEVVPRRTRKRGQCMLMFLQVNTLAF